MNFKDAQKLFLNVEESNNVYKLKYKDIMYWKLIRKELFEYIIAQNGFSERAHPLTKLDKIKRLKLLIKYSIINLMKKRNLKPFDYLILTHGRKGKFNESYVDVYLYDIIKNLEEENRSYLIVDRPDHYGNHFGQNIENQIYYERFGHIKRNALHILFSRNINLKDTKGNLIDIENEIYTKFGVKVDLISMVRKKLFRFIYEKHYFDRLLDKVKPKEIYLVVSYGKEELIASAKERGIYIREVQHGVISDYHMGYYFPFDLNIPYFPDEIITFGTYWIDSVKFPCNSKQIVREFSCLKPDYENILKSESKMDVVLFISQGNIGEQLSEVASTFIKNNENVQVYYKLHPSEFSNWKERYKKLADCEHRSQLEVVTTQMSIYELFNKCKYVVGVNSTAIYESLLFECQTFVVDIEGYQYMDYLITEGYVKYISKNFNFNDLRTSSTKVLIDKQYFYQ